jgi:fructuronate reductase
MNAATAPVPRLSLSTLHRVPTGVRRPLFGPEQLTVGVVHLGVGAFHRAHQAVYTEDALSKDDLRWGILGISLRRPDAAQQLLPQDCLFTVEQLGASADYRIIGVVRGIITGPEQPEAVFEAIASPHVHLITLTVTEKGYTLTTNGDLDVHHADVIADLRATAPPQTTVGWLTGGLVQRYRNGRKPVTVVCCDNLSSNGAKLRGAVLQFARELNADAARWIDAEVCFPNTMVDRLVPAADAMTRARVQNALGLRDLACVQCEEFSQWIIEDSFSGPRPAWEKAGARFVSDVAAHEKLKLHVLNATHSALAYLGLRRGHVFVREAIADPELESFLDRLIVEEIVPSLSPLPAFDYWTVTKRRFANPRINHALSQIAEDGSVKLAQRVYPTLIANARAGRSTHCLARIVQAWLEFARGPVKDPNRERLESWSKTGGHVAAALDDPVLFPEPFRAEPSVRAALLPMTGAASRDDSLNT